MDRDTVIALAREAGVQPIQEFALMGAWVTNTDAIQRFAALVEEHLKAEGYRHCAKGQRTTQWCGMLEQAVRIEREECAKVCEARYMGDNNREDMEAKRCAAAIRSRT